MQEEVDIRPEEEEDLPANVDNDAAEEDAFDGFENAEEMELDEMEPDESLEPVGEQSPNTREAFEEDEEDDLLLAE